MKKIILIVTIVAVILGGTAFGYNRVIANPSRIVQPISCTTQGTSATSISTSSQSYLTAGTGTTTATCNITLGGLGTDAINSSALAIIMAASSTNANLRVNIEYSHNGNDWYQDGGSFFDGFATSSKPFDISQVNQFSLTFASSTSGLGTVGNFASTTSNRILSLRVPTKWIRAVFTVPAGSGAVSFWAGFINKSEAIR